MAEMTVDRAAARRFLVRRHLLAPPRSLPADPASVKVVIERLGSLQFDPLDVTGRNHDLVLAARIDGYARVVRELAEHGHDSEGGGGKKTEEASHDIDGPTSRPFTSIAASRTAS